MKFTKMHGIGNDYIYVNCMDGIGFDPEQASIALSDRHFGVGSDGMILIFPSDKADFRMRMFNADGSEGKMCGNGIRCFAKYVYCKGLTDKTVLTIETLAGIKTAWLILDDHDVAAIRVNMGSPVLEPALIPVSFDGEQMVNEAIEVGGSTWHVTAISMGNPQMRVWERGSGETWACGTGACAVAVASILNGVVSSDSVTVKLRGGDLLIEWNRAENTVYMTGPATFVYEGELKE